MRELLGGKGANLAEMANLGLPVPPGFTITTEVCTYFYDHGRKYPPELEAQVNEGLAEMGRIVGHSFGSDDDPVLVSVRSGARASMPGMMDTVLNLGLSDHTVEAIAKRSGNPRFAYDSYRRFIQMYSNVVLDIDHHQFEEILEEYKERKSFTLDTDLKAEDWKKVIVLLQGQGRGGDGQAVPAGPQGPAMGRDRRRVRLVDEPARRHLSPPAEHSGLVGHGRQRTVDGVRQHGRHLGHRRRLHPQPLDRRARPLRRVPHQRAGAKTSSPASARRRTSPSRPASRRVRKSPSMETALPAVFEEFKRTTYLLEKHYRDMQDMEFTVEDGKLWMLQTRSGKRTARASIRIAVDMANDGLISREEAGAAHRSRLARPAAAPDDRPGRRAQDRRDRAAGLARRCVGRDRLQLRGPRRRWSPRARR